MSEPLKSKYSCHYSSIIHLPSLCLQYLMNINIYTNLSFSLQTTEIHNAVYSFQNVSHGEALWQHILITLHVPKYITLQHFKVPRVSSKEVKYLGRA